MRPPAVWITFAFASAVLLGALAWGSAALLGMERERRDAAESARVEQAARLVLESSTAEGACFALQLRTAGNGT